MTFKRPPCLSTLRLGDGRGRYSRKIVAFYNRLCLMAQIALEQTGSTVIAFSAEEEAKLLSVCPNTVRNWNAYLIDNNVLDPLDQKGGRGKKATFVFHFET